MSPSQKPTLPRRARLPLTLAALLPLAGPLLAAIPEAAEGTQAGFAAPPLEALPMEAGSRLRPLVERYRADRRTLEHVRALADAASDPLFAPRRNALRHALLISWQRTLEALPSDGLSQDDRLDRLLLQRDIALALEAETFERERFEAIRPLLPGYEALVALLEARRDLRQAEGRAAADTLEAARLQLAEAHAALSQAKTPPSPTLALRAAQHAEALKRALADWQAHQAGFDPEFGWWVDAPYKALDEQLGKHISLLRETLGGGSGAEALSADPIGDAAIVRALRAEGIPYSPAELMAAAERELAWCRAELEKAAREMGARDWREAIERVKQVQLPPGGQPALVVELADEAMAFLEAHDLVSVPPGTRRGWRMNMLSPEWQLQAPFFLGGRDVWVAYPAAGMPHERKLNAIRGNNRHFSRAVVHHELVPGHHLQYWHAQRHARHREGFGSPFWDEGWALYWELRLYDLGFATTPEDRVGMLFWRSHRAARILFSLGIQSGRMSPEEAVRLLVERVGHEPENARAEVRRSIAGDYGPLYQVAYLVGGWQFRALHEERVRQGGWSEREFHDRVLREGSMPIHLLRERLFDRVENEAPRQAWRFLDSAANASAR
ncbi:DUF885 family protein [Silanimonas lenta]|uniref:DUF885 family protein n=3 Tax=Silanimonas lenta TaxID=265429 RepID=UPI0003FA5094|nr:DUF885 family protein [Silanimonas lenta]